MESLIATILLMLSGLDVMNVNEMHPTLVFHFSNAVLLEKYK